MTVGTLALLAAAEKKFGVDLDFDGDIEGRHSGKHGKHNSMHKRDSDDELPFNFSKSGR